MLEEKEWPVGCPRLFSMELHLLAVQQMIRSDEVAEALRMLDNVPGYYRENPHPAAITVKKVLLRQLVHPLWYSRQAHDYDWDVARGAFDACWPRSHAVLKEVLEFNAQGIIPTVVDLAPGVFWLPVGLEQRNAKFKYQPMTLNHLSLHKFKEEFPTIELVDTPQDNTIFCAFELIEHLWNPVEIFQHYLQLGTIPKFIMISTPLYTYNCPADQWHTADLAHLRTYSKQDLITYCHTHWPNYDWALCPEEVMVIIGKLRE